MSQEDTYRWEELKRIEKQRRAILLRVEEPFWKILSHWDGTVLRILALDPIFWFTIVVYVVIRARARTDLPDFVDQLSSGNMTILGGFLTFFLVFYVNQNHKRYFGLYDHSMACKGRIFDVATIAVTTLPKPMATRLVRYMNAAHAAGYVGLSKVYPSQSYFRHVNETLGLLTDRELKRMNEMDLDKGGSCSRELIVWCLQEIQTARANNLVDPELANQLREQVLKLRASIGQFYNAADLPIPFFYVHFITLLTSFYLPLFAVTSAYKAGTGEDVHWSVDIVVGLVVFLQSIFVLGLRTLGQKMSDPYGDDLVDLSVMFYVDFTWTHSNRILNATVPSHEADWDEEQRLIDQRKTIGAAWEGASSSSSDEETVDEPEEKKVE